ncbi:glycosyltransferase [Marinilabilia salmonicolor]|uniref:glycosyltransferase n=1 Tax=Marinilabilia salmonicolor TaxID=989 RepID=UPI00029B01C1|nr:glycosyltransferase [Marinilabilia salmonicolor]
MKIALIHDGIICRGGAERVFLSFLKAFPNADIFSTVYYPENSFPEFSNYKINTTWYQKIAKDEYSYRKLFFPIGAWAAKSIDLSNYDVVLQSTTTGAKYAKFGKQTIVISYCHQPFRLLWNPNSYNQYKNAGRIKKRIFDALISHYRKVDYKSANRVNIFIANSKTTSLAIKEHYNRNSDYIVNPPTGVSQKNYKANPKDYYLLVSRLEPYKKVDLAIEAFNDLKEKLIIVGKGTQKNRLKTLSKTNIEFREGISDNELDKLYTHCKAFIFPQREDYGITPLESISAGKPVIAFGEGGVLETMIPYNGRNEEECTAILFENQTKNDLIEAVKLSQSLSFNSRFIFQHSLKFNEEHFIEKIQNIVQKHSGEINFK